MGDRLNLCVTMDCEQLGEDYRAAGSGNGPATWADARDAVDAFADMVETVGGRATFYVVPLTATKIAPLLRELDGRGHEIGLHLHPCVFETPGRYAQGLARHDPEKRRLLLERASAVWADATGRSPKTFRPGNFSADADAFSLFADLGMTHGSVSCPGRDASRLRAVWTDWPDYPHRVGGFVDVPLTTDRRRVLPNGFPMEFRVEQCGESPDEMPFDVVRRRLREFEAWPDATPRCIVGLTHNSVPYHRRPERELRVVSRIVEICTAEADASGTELAVVPVRAVAEAVAR